MGNFGRFVFSNGEWNHYDGDDRWDQGIQTCPYLAIDVYDSDYASVEYKPAGTASGNFYLRIQPRDHFEDPTANEWVDVDEEAAGLAAWAHAALGRTISSATLLPFIAPEGVEEPEDVFVEETMERLLGRLGLAMPGDA